MELQEREAVQELLKKIPEDKLEEAVGGMSERNKNILGAAGLFLAGVGIGVGGKLAWDKWGPKKEEPIDPKILAKGFEEAKKFFPVLSDKSAKLEDRVKAGLDYHKALYGGTLPKGVDEEFIKGLIKQNDESGGWEGWTATLTPAAK